MTYTIKPHKKGPLWVFTDKDIGVKDEALVRGTDQMLEYACRVRGIDRPENGFNLTFSDKPFAGHRFTLYWKGHQDGWNQYALADGKMTGQSGWLCPVLGKYFGAHAPWTIYVQVA